MKGPDVFIVSVADLDKPPSDMKYHGFLPDVLRFPLVGHDITLAEHLSSQRASRSGTGNAYAVPSLASALIPLVDQAVKSGVMATLKRPAKTTDDLHGIAAYRDYKRRRLGAL